ncbi:MAG: hypothetical protein FJ265_11185 [Planctomycetes bacterium]|nr:hypothetical protein [Planctomycetota bacterium]
MKNDLCGDPGLSNLREDALLADLEIRCRADLASARDQAARRSAVRVTVRAADVVDRARVLAELRTSELSRTHLLGIADRPVMVGSLFQLTFAREDLDHAPALAVCDRCTMLGDESFEVRFRTVQEIDAGAAPGGRVS